MLTDLQLTAADGARVAGDGASETDRASEIDLAAAADRASVEVSRAAVAPSPLTNADAGAELPFVSIVIPCLDEERYIGGVLERFAGQYEAARFEIVVVDGMSRDATRDIVGKFAARDGGPQVRLVDNPARRIPVALNLGIAAARGEIIARMDAHTVPPPDYVRRAVELLGHEGAAVVGMPCKIEPGAATLTARAVARAVAHPFGIGDAQYRLVSEGGPRAVDTVPFGVFRKSLWAELGGFDETLHANEDYDFNYRARAAGGRVLLDGRARTTYFARPTLGALARQYFRYGYWKAQMAKRRPRSLRWRQLVAPAFVVALASSAALAPFFSPFAFVLALVAGSYAAADAFFSTRVAAGEGDVRLAPLLAAAFLVIHLSWGAGFLAGLPLPRR